MKPGYLILFGLLVIMMISIAPATAQIATGSISGLAYIDSKDNGVGNVPINLKDSSGNYVASTSTAADGTYSFVNLSNGNYIISEWLSIGVGSYNVSISSGDHVTDIDFKNAEPSVSIQLVPDHNPVHPGDNITYTPIVHLKQGGLFSWDYANIFFTIDPHIVITDNYFQCLFSGNSITCNDAVGPPGSDLNGPIFYPIHGIVKSDTAPGTVLTSSWNIGFVGYGPLPGLHGPIGASVTDTTLVVRKGSPGPCPVPEFPSALIPGTFILGLLGTIFYIRRTREK